jgi:hypothetical protein
MRLALGVMLALAVSVPAWAQDNSEIVVTGMRRNMDNDGDNGTNSVPVIGLRRRGDFLVQLYTIVSDTREFTTRRTEVYATLLNVLEQAEKNSDIQISVGTSELRAVTKANYRAISLDSNFRNRTDTSHVSIYVKHKLAQDGGNAKSAVLAIESFAKGVKLTGRSEILPVSDTQISLINPQQYRYAILQLVADDSKKIAGMFGPNYGVNFSGFTQPVEWIGETPTEVFLFVRYGAGINPTK